MARKRSRSPWIRRTGKLGGKGFLSKSPTTQRKILSGCVKKYGYRSCLGSVMVLNRNRSIRSKHGSKINSLVKYLKGKYGGKGSFGMTRKSRRKSRAKKSR